MENEEGKPNATECPMCDGELRLIVEISYSSVPFTINEHNEYLYDKRLGILTREDIYLTYCPRCQWEFVH